MTCRLKLRRERKEIELPEIRTRLPPPPFPSTHIFPKKNPYLQYIFAHYLIVSASTTASPTKFNKPYGI
ncbi:hypothetical protein RB195_000556 [Necator americanus]|uniref:Uncharacterized protein n=1 Tax=Necator americanus TaxID=51031 RepID=A0ABR1DB09_NECAM